MPKFVVERNVPGVGALAAGEIEAISRKSCGVLRAMPEVQWMQSYVTDDKIYCIYLAPDADAIREHAQRGGFPANSVARIRRVIDPSTADPSTAEGISAA